METRTNNQGGLSAVVAVAAATTATTTNNNGNSAAGDVPSGFILKLYQMVGNEGISWTEDGDAFIIGSDIKRLESETLPQFFRHNRFQSLVRQLNFYSFRKINRERNVWIYKHELFHRDHPEDLHMVRRRTCPGVDGRKQRVVAASAATAATAASASATRVQEQPPPPPPPSSLATARRVSDIHEGKPADDDSSLGSSSEDQNNSQYRKRSGDASRKPAPSSKRTRRSQQLNEESFPSPPKEDLIVDTSLIEAAEAAAATEAAGAVFAPAVAGEVDEQASLSTSKTDRATSSAEPAMTVSEVSKKLEQYARKAMNGGGRRTRSGVVTPPTSSTATSLLTYDDEYEYRYTGKSTSSTSGVVVDAEGTLAAGDKMDHCPFATPTNTASAVNRVTPTKASEEVVVTPPLMDGPSALAVASRILECAPIHQRPALLALTTVAGFCMSTSPQGDKDLCGKILKLISSCDKLSSEFQLYRSALHPAESTATTTTTRGVGSPATPPRHSFTPHYAKKKRGGSAQSSPSAVDTVQKVWEREASRGDAVRDFKTFALNCIRSLLFGKTAGNSGGTLVGDGCDDSSIINNVSANLIESDKQVLERTADLWLTSVGIAA